MSRSTNTHNLDGNVIIVTRHEIRNVVHYTSSIERPIFRTVLGTYKTEGDALQAAELVIAMAGEDRLCSPRDIDRVRRDNAKLQKPIDPAPSMAPSRSTPVEPL